MHKVGIRGAYISSVTRKISLFAKISYKVKVLCQKAVLSVTLIRVTYFMDDA